MKKKCSRCSEEKAVDSFSPDPRKPLGRDSRCKACRAELRRERYAADPAKGCAESREYYQNKKDDPGFKTARKEQHRRWYRKNIEVIKENVRKYQAENPEKMAEYLRRQRQRFPEKAKARRELNLAVHRGKLAKPSQCERCRAKTTSRSLHGHHEDYSKPLEVEWLCVSCHAAHHYEIEDYARPA